MKISCILTSYNRPRWVRHALKSVADQTYKNYELIVLDESTILDIQQIIREFPLACCKVRHSNVGSSQRVLENRLSINMNAGLSMATGDLICFLCDDDYYYSGWFESAAAFFSARPDVSVAYGKLRYSSEREMVFSEDGNVRYPGGIVTSPFDLLDHNQVIHRRFIPPFRWPEDPRTIAGPDAHYWASIARHHAFHPIESFAAVKRVHEKNLQRQWQQYLAGGLEESRE